MYKVLYVLFLFCASVLSLQTYSFFLTPRQTFAVLMFVVCVYEEKKLFVDKFIIAYFIFVFFYGLSSFVTGYENEFILRLFGDYFVAYVAIWAIRILVTKYDGLKLFIYSFLTIAIFDGFVTLCQFMGWGFLDVFLNRLQLISYQPYLNNYQGTGADLFLRCAPGIFSHPVLNAHALAAGTVISTYIACKKNFVIGLVLSLTMLIFLFATQQRTAFAIGLLSISIIVFLKSIRSNYRSVVLPFIFIIASYSLFELYEFIMNGDFRFSELGSDATGRESIYRACVNFIADNPLGGINKYVNTTSSYPHNLIYNAFIFGGWLGGLVLLFIVFLQCLEIYKTIRTRNVDITEIIMALASLSLLVNGLTHNQSIVNGEILTWTVWGAFYYSKVKNLRVKKKQRYQYKTERK